MAQRALRSTAPGKRRGPGGGRCKARGRSREPPSPLAFPSRPRAGRGAPPAEKCARRGRPAPGRGPARGSSRTERPSLTRRVESPGGLRGPHPFTSQRLRWSLPPALGCIPKQPDSEKTGPRRDGGRYRPHTVHGLSLDQKDSGPRATPGKRSSVRHISHARPSDGDSALGSSLFARRY
ncbi:hypothetical protein PAMP_025050 [Pampus punctatissimus]